MRALEARQISIEEYLSLNGLSPLKKTNAGQELWYSSPIRDGDKHPSFKVDTHKNLWFDFGVGKGGNVLDLVCEIQHITVKEALAILEQTGLYSGHPRAMNQLSVNFQRKLAVKKRAGEKEKAVGEDAVVCKFDVLGVSELNHPELIDFLKQRKITLSVARQYLKQVHYKPVNRVKSYYALGWACGDGFEARSPLFKCFIGTRKDIIKVNLKNGQSVSVFEGFMDFLAFLSFYHIEDFKNSVIILNTVNLKKRALAELKCFEFSKMYLFLDNDQGGEETKTFLSTAMSPLPTVDKSSVYQGCNDFNQWVIENDEEI